jgi:hypothetical protein
VRLLAERYFGKMVVDEEKVTDSSGVVLFAVPVGLPGDTAGNISFSAKFTDEESFGTASMDTVLKAGAVTIPVSLTEKRAMWNTVRKAPIWIILAYGLGVIAVWGFIILVMLKLRDIFTVGTVLSEGLKGSNASTETTKQPQI